MKKSNNERNALSNKSVKHDDSKISSSANYQSYRSNLGTSTQASSNATSCFSSSYFDKLEQPQLQQNNETKSAIKHSSTAIRDFGTGSTEEHCEEYLRR